MYLLNIRHEDQNEAKLTSAAAVVDNVVDDVVVVDDCSDWLLYSHP